MHQIEFRLVKNGDFSYAIIFHSPVRGVPVGILPSCLVCKKLEWSVYPMVKTLKIYNRLDRIPDRQTDRHLAAQGVSHTHTSGGLIPPTFSQHPPRLQGEGGREGKGEGKGKQREGKGRDPQGLVDTPMFQILKNTLLSRHSSALCIGVAR